MQSSFQPSEPPAESDSAFLNNFKTPISFGRSSYALNDNANLLPTRADQYRDTSTFNDFKLNNGLAVARAYRKSDSLGANTASGFSGHAEPSKMFGRDSKSYDLNFVRWQLDERARTALKQMGSKAGEVPTGGYIQPWAWNDHQDIGEGGVLSMPDGSYRTLSVNQYNRHYGVPDADAVARRLYQPAPSRLTKMLATDVETAALRQNQTLLDPVKVVSEDRQRMKQQRVPRNADVIESVVYDNIFPRGFQAKVEAPYVFPEASTIRQATGSNETGSKAVLGRWNNGFTYLADPMAAVTNEDFLLMQKNTQAQIRGHDIEAETQRYREAELKLLRQTVDDPTGIQPREPVFMT